MSTHIVACLMLYRHRQVRVTPFILFFCGLFRFTFIFLVYFIPLSNICRLLIHVKNL